MFARGIKGFFYQLSNDFIGEPHIRPRTPSRHGDCYRGASEQAIGITKGGRNSKIHGFVDKLCRPWVLILTPGNTADCTVGPACVSLLDGIAELLGDKAYDSNSFRKSLRKDGIKPVIPGRSNRKKRIRHDKQAYKDRNVIERCYCRLKDFRRIATRYDKLACASLPPWHSGFSRARFSAFG